MGNSDIRDMAYIEEQNVSDISGYNVAVDASNWLYKYMTTTTKFTSKSAYTTDSNDALPNLIGVPRGIRKYLKHNINPVFVFDGKPHKLKRGEINRRKEKRKTAQEKANNASTAKETSKYESRSQELNDTIVGTTKEVLDILDIPYIEAPQAAESQAAHMTASDKIDAAVSDDYDSLIFASDITVRNFTTSSEFIEDMSFKKTLDEYDITHRQLIVATILCGTDYNDGVHGIGPKTAIKKVKDTTNFDTLQSELDGDLEHIEEIYELYRNPTVTDDWSDPRIPQSDTTELKSYLKGKGIGISEVQKAIDDIDKYGTQTGLESF